MHAGKLWHDDLTRGWDPKDGSDQPIVEISPSGGIRGEGMRAFLRVAEDGFFNDLRDPLSPLFVPREHAVILLLDSGGGRPGENHVKPHIFYEFMKAAQHYNVVPVYLPRYTTPLLMPLDQRPHALLKEKLGLGLDKFRRRTNGMVVTRFNVMPPLQFAIENALTHDVITEGLRSTGMVPWNPAYIYGNRDLFSNQDATTDSAVAKFKDPISRSVCPLPELLKPRKCAHCAYGLQWNWVLCPKCE